jgi:uncharacterized membrane protein YvlD (DUF360 family)
LAGLGTTKDILFSPPTFEPPMARRVWEQREGIVSFAVLVQTSGAQGVEATFARLHATGTIIGNAFIVFICFFFFPLVSMYSFPFQYMVFGFFFLCLYVVW